MNCSITAGNIRNAKQPHISISCSKYAGTVSRIIFLKAAGIRRINHPHFPHNL
ncbi:hypothetical protein [Microcoleus sp. FACHB-68]|uniref:hypothetical protein n=1 Tax=Microcoleus sp. FACHB-68 TaxID=2692826 RepID=UPI001A7E9A52|nr:hypothetical protein [Microcoleus sp. FACHB-68]